MLGQNSERRTHLLQLSPRDLLKEVFRTGEKLSRQEILSVGLVDTTNVIIDEEYALGLGKLLLDDPFGITQSGVVRARFADESETNLAYDWTDGLHRTVGLKKVHPDHDNAEMKYEVLYGCTDEELYRRRIIAANNVTSIRFARVCVFINDAWKLTPWSNILSATQAFYLANDLGSGARITESIEEADVEAIKDWARKSALAWNRGLGTIYQDLLTFERSDPELVLKVRSGSSFQRGELAVTPSQLSKIADVLPHSKFPEIQKIIAYYINSIGASTAKLEAVLEEVKSLSEISPETVSQTLQTEEWKKRLPPKKTKSTKDAQLEIEGQLTQAGVELEQSKEKALIVEEIEPSLQVALNYLNSAQQVISQIPALNINKRKKLIKGIDDVVSNLVGQHSVKNKTASTNKLTGKVRESSRLNINAAMAFSSRWLSGENLRKISEVAEIRDDFKNDLEGLNGAGIVTVAKFLTHYLISVDEAKRTIGKNVFSLLPINILESDQIENLFEELGNRLTNDIEERLYSKSSVAGAINNILQLVDEMFIPNQIKMTEEIKERFFDSIIKAAKFTDEDTRSEIIEWLGRHRYLLVDLDADRRTNKKK